MKRIYLPPTISTRGLLALSILALLAAFSYGLLLWLNPQTEEASRQLNNEPLLIIENFQALRLNAKGQQELLVIAPHLAQFPNPLGTRITQPLLDWYQTDGQTREWQLSAEQGWIAADQQTLRLEGAVHLVRTAESGKPPVTINTRDLLLRPNARYAETAALTTATTPQGEFQALGVRAWLDEERIELLAEVRGTYAAPKP